VKTPADSADPRGAIGPAGRPTPILFVENSIGLSGSTMSLEILLSHLDRGVVEPYALLSRPEQLSYLRDALRAPVELDIVSPPAKLTARPPLAALVARLRVRAPRAARALMRGLAGADLLLRDLPYERGLYRWARVRNVALIHHNNGFDASAVAVARRLGVPLVAYQRGDEWDSPRVRRLLPSVDRFIANSKATRQNLLSLGVDSGRIVVIYPPVDLRRFEARPGRHVSRSSLGIPDAAPCFGIVGMLLPWKGHHVFLQAARHVMDRLPEARAVIVGAGPSGRADYELELKQLAASLGIADRVLFLGYRPDVPDVIGTLDVVAHTSIDPEPFGRVIAEAMAMARPVVASAAGGPTEIIEHGRTGFLVPPGEPPVLAERMLELLQDGGLARRIGAAGQLEIKRRFSADRHARLVEGVYLEVLLQSRQPSTTKAGTPAPGPRAWRYGYRR
jgi:glycosyltransferase involved in cell wall biosynthesis